MKDITLKLPEPQINWIKQWKRNGKRIVYRLGWQVGWSGSCQVKLLYERSLQPKPKFYSLNPFCNKQKIGCKWWKIHQKRHPWCTHHLMHVEHWNKNCHGKNIHTKFKKK